MDDNGKHYVIITKRFQLQTEYDEWFDKTRKLYNEVLIFYYCLFLKYSELHSLGKQKAMRRMEELTIVGRDKMPVPEKLPWIKLPLYFRRSAISQAIAAGKSYLARNNQELVTESFDASIVLYKGMYKDLNAHSIMIKLFNGEGWVWVQCRLSGNNMDVSVQYLSPKVVFKRGRVELHVPVREYVQDGRTLKERMENNPKICCINFFNRDVFAICCVMDMQMHVQAVRYIRGGNDYQRRCNYWVGRIEHTWECVGGKTHMNANRRYWTKLKHVNENMTHQISRQIVDFCKESQADILVLPKYSEEFSKFVMARSGKWTPIRLNYSIRNQLQYKVWQSGMVVVETPAHNIRRYCAVCGSITHEKGENFICEQGHQGDRRLNAVRNLGRNFIEGMRKRQQ